MFALWYLSLAVDEIRQRVNCPAHLWSQKNAQTIPGPAKEPQVPTNAPQAPAAAGDQSKGAAPKSPLKPVDPIVIPKDTPNEDERLKQLESPETVELIKSFEIPDPVTPVSEPVAPTPEPPKRVPSPPPPVAVKPQPVVAPEPEAKPQPAPKAPTNDPTEALFSPPAQQQKQGDNKPTTKDIKEATTDFLAQEYSQPKKATKRYTKSRQKNNHS